MCVCKEPKPCCAVCGGELPDLAAEVARLRAVLEEIGDGACLSKYGPGCDDGCKRIAYAGLATTSAPTAAGGKTGP